MNKPRIAVDVMGGDHGPEVIVEGAVQAVRTADVSALLVGDSKTVHTCLSRYGRDELDIEVVHASEVAEMGEKPSDIMRRKKDSSMQVAFRLVREGKADGVVSAGNSGAALACGIFTLGRIKGIERPALATVLPTEGRPLVLLDVGANVDCKPKHLVQFALMANVFAKNVLQIEQPKVGILSIGEEEGKGNAQVKKAYELLKAAPLNFIGNIEGRDLFDGQHADVAVCDGFTGNIALKLTEGLASALGNILCFELKQSWLSRLGMLLSIGALLRFKQRCDYAEYGGAPLLGLKGVTMVCHGKSNSKAICNAVKMAGIYVSKRTNESLVSVLEQMQEDGDSQDKPLGL